MKFKGFWSWERCKTVSTVYLFEHASHLRDTWVMLMNDDALLCCLLCLVDELILEYAVLDYLVIDYAISLWNLCALLLHIMYL